MAACIKALRAAVYPNSKDVFSEHRRRRFRLALNERDALCVVRNVRHELYDLFRRAAATYFNIRFHLAPWIDLYRLIMSLYHCPRINSTAFASFTKFFVPRGALLPNAKISGADRSVSLSLSKSIWQAGGLESKLSRHSHPREFLLKSFGFSGRSNCPAPAIHAAGHDWKLERASILSISPRLFRQTGRRFMAVKRRLFA